MVSPIDRSYDNYYDSIERLPDHVHAYPLDHKQLAALEVTFHILGSGILTCHVLSLSIQSVTFRDCCCCCCNVGAVVKVPGERGKVNRGECQISGAEATRESLLRKNKAKQPHCSLPLSFDTSQSTEHV